MEQNKNIMRPKRSSRRVLKNISYDENSPIKKPRINNLEKENQHESLSESDVLNNSDDEKIPYKKPRIHNLEKENQNESPKAHKCKLCEKSYSLWSSLYNHFRNFHELGRDDIKKIYESNDKFDDSEKENQNESLSEYEKIRLQNIAERDKMFKQFKLKNLASNLNKTLPKLKKTFAPKPLWSTNDDPEYMPQVSNSGNQKQSKNSGKPKKIGAYQCRFCEYEFENLKNLKRHVLIHFKDQLLCDLPTSLPFKCPECTYVSKEKTTLLRHYAFGHRKVFDFATEEDFKARKYENIPSESQSAKDSAKNSGKTKKIVEKSLPKKKKTSVKKSLSKNVYKLKDCSIKIRKIKIKKTFQIIRVNIPKELFPLNLKNYDLLDIQNVIEKC